MKYTQILIVWVFILVLAAPVFSLTLQQPQKDYSADFVVQVTIGQEEPLTIPGKVYYSKGKERRETVMMGRKNITIRREDKTLLWTLMPENRMYMEHSLDGDSRDRDPAMMVRENDVEITQVASEKVNGVQTVKYRMRVTDPQSEPIEGFIWLSKDNIPVRIEGESTEGGERNQFVIDTKNIQLGPQSSYLFELPAGYQRMQMPAFGNSFGARKGTMQPDAPSSSDSSMEISPEQMKQFQLQMEQLKKQMGVQ